jgi:hypothetical protein
MGKANCPVCGARATGELPGALCPACLVALALEAGDDASESPEPGYRILTVLSEDAERIVHLAQPFGTAALVTVETVRAFALGPRPEAIGERLARLRALAHPAIARVLQAWLTVEGECCLVSEYAGGQAVGHVPLDAGTALAAFDAVCAGLEAAHAQGVVHGRLTASSVRLVGSAAGQLAPRISGFSVGPDEPRVEDDVSALGDLLASLVSHVIVSEAVSAVVRRAAGRDTGGPARFPSVAALRAEVARAARQNL